MLALTQDDGEVLRALLRCKRVFLEHEGLQIAVQHRQRSAQIVRDLGHQIASEGVLLLEFLDLFDDAPGHLIEGNSQTVHLVRCHQGGFLLGAGRCAEVAEPEAVHGGAQPLQAPREQTKHDETRQQSEGEGGRDRPCAQAREVAAPGELVDEVVHLTAQHHVQVSLRRVRRGYRSYGKCLAPIVTARIVTEQRKACRIVQKRTNGFQRNVLAFDLPGFGGVREDTAVEIQQINLDAGIDQHVVAKHGLQGRLVDSALGHQIPIGDQVARQITIELLIDLGEIDASSGQAYQGVYQSHGGDKHHQSQGELGVQGPKHRAPYISVNL